MQPSMIIVSISVVSSIKTECLNNRLTLHSEILSRIVGLERNQWQRRRWRHHPAVASDGASTSGGTLTPGNTDIRAYKVENENIRVNNIIILAEPTCEALTQWSSMFFHECNRFLQLFGFQVRFSKYIYCTSSSFTLCRQGFATLNYPLRRLPCPLSPHPYTFV